MYYWNIEALKQQLKTGPLSEAHAFKYFLLLTLIYTVALSSGAQQSYLEAILLLVITLVGYYHTFRCNGAEHGSQYLAKITALSFVYGIRFLILIVIPVSFLLGIMWSIAAGMSGEDTITTLDSILLLTEDSLSVLFSIFYFWRLGHHMSDTTSTEVAK